MENRKFHIWSEGYSITGNNSGAIYLGEFEADTFEHACDKWAKTLTDDYSRKCYSPAKDGKPPSFWVAGYMTMKWMQEKHLDNKRFY